MQIVIDIPDGTLAKIKRTGFVHIHDADKIGKAINKGTVLPKGHGRIGDLDAVMSDICSGINAMTNIGIAVDGEYLWAKLNNAIDNAPTIIEASSEED